jgi:hypothetical protein
MFNPTHFGWPEWAYILILACAAIVWALDHNKIVPSKKENFFKSVFFAAIEFILLYFGGFFK